MNRAPAIASAAVSAGTLVFRDTTAGFLRTALGDTPRGGRGQRSSRVDESKIQAGVTAEGPLTPQSPAAADLLVAGNPTPSTASRRLVEDVDATHRSQPENA